MTSEIESLSREFAKLAGIEWYEDWYLITHHGERNPDFSDAREVIRVMWKRSDWKDFVLWFANRRTPELNVFVVIGDMENETGEMLELAVDWMKGREANNAD